jgi:DNA (cytosine-5)-methyltransferase 1
VRLLDLFCGAGGSAVGYHRAGFDEIVGIDIVPQKNYPFTFIQGDALKPPVRLEDFDLIHASPPCQAYSDLQKRTRRSYPDLIAPTRRLIRDYPYIIENVEGAPLYSPLLLCGVMFPGLRVLRHRLFESSHLLMAPQHMGHPLVFTHDKRKSHYGKLDQNTSFVQVTGGGNCSVRTARSAMGIDWMTKPELNEAIPPAFTEYLGRQFLDQLARQPQEVSE